ncbi:DUF4166 domain-containing protein [Leucobacter sp. UT-8R-CII-1-4]|uniref:DUF4166 domain-containing protein n=1 Tax=Leucobacter sp. UT-8R-CII-1-4 TaxID=3040075 RepID=UPI0024A801BC|nr:DUF4166 domain-containing protein [Leucobacter sp. UT-8R-CII-1-4]MDI6023238.1 DUF4166 domain-containing protein [Leucobacter sp. UT-8R-CII-1-4]
MTTRSPYEAMLGERIDELHPSLRRYFSAIPEGYIGVGEGVFAEFGTPRRWLWPILRVLQSRGVLYAGFARSARFRVINRTVAIAGSEFGAAEARREIDVPGGNWTMVDSVIVTGGTESAPPGVVDRLGDPHTVSAQFTAEVKDGALSMTSIKAGLRWGGLRIRLPRWCAPVVHLTEAYDPVSGLQRITLSLTAPIVGKIYEYRGHFAYGIVKEHPNAAQQ